MRILFVDQFSDLGGAQFALRDVMREGAERGWEMWFAAPGGGTLFEYCRASGIGARALPVGAYRNGSKSILDIARYAIDMARSAKSIHDIVRRNRIDLVYANGPRILAAAAGIRCPLIFHLHSAVDKTYSRTIVRLILKRTQAAVITASRYVAGTLGKEPGDGSLRVIYNGVGDFGFVPRPRAGRTGTVAIIGRIAAEKGHLDFVHAARMLAARGRDARFIVVGATLFSDPSYAARVREAAAGSPVEFCGWTDDVASVLHEIDVLAVPSSGAECSPRILIEAFSAGTPIVAYPSGGIPEIVRDRDSGLLTANNTPEALAAAIDQLMTDRGCMARFSANGRREWEARFRIDRFRNEVAELVERRGHVESRQPETATAVAGEDYLSRAGAPHR